MKEALPNILFLVPYPLRTAPSQRFRVEQFLPLLDSAGITYRVEPFLGTGWLSKGRMNRSSFGMIFLIFVGFWRRMRLLMGGLKEFDYVFIHREAAPLGPPVLEWLIARAFRKRIIYDFDDSIWMADPNPSRRWFDLLKSRGKVKSICRWSSQVVGGNEYLCAFAKKYQPFVTCIPTVLDIPVDLRSVKTHGGTRPVVGWTGSSSTILYLNALIPLLQRLENQLLFEFLVIADQDPRLPLRSYRFIPWRYDTERDDLLQIDIGIMPLTADPWSEGKCGFKLIQYQSVGIPAIASPVGVNSQLIKNGENGYLCESEQEWEDALRMLIGSADLRQDMGMRGWESVIGHFSLAAQSGSFLGLFRD